LRKGGILTSTVHLSEHVRRLGSHAFFAIQTSNKRSRTTGYEIVARGGKSMFFENKGIEYLTSTSSDYVSSEVWHSTSRTGFRLCTFFALPCSQGMVCICDLRVGVRKYLVSANYSVTCNYGRKSAVVIRDYGSHESMDYFHGYSLRPKSFELGQLRNSHHIGTTTMKFPHNFRPYPRLCCLCCRGIVPACRTTMNDRWKKTVFISSLIRG
jgi:hypothetical protein